ncbi:MAG: hypothetical protein Q8N23_24205 [Archangium sp.]|nr:hypothetical protein [Archangium sp.]MDP3155798.1 hypothetical protein [Archangium sp.]MDP3574172.1 hypothetical protein [Archangium sp.]
MKVDQHPRKRRAPVKKRPGDVEVDEAQTVDAPPKPLILGTAMETDGLGEELAETFVENATGADDAATEHRAAITVAEEGGPFVHTSGATEFAAGTDASNPPDALREALPTVRKP